MRITQGKTNQQLLFDNPSRQNQTAVAAYESVDNQAKKRLCSNCSVSIYTLNMTSPTSGSASFFNQYRLIILLIVAVVVSRLPIISIPFNWLESYFHELSHGLAAIVSGGSIIKIELFTNGAGLCTTLGGIVF